MTETLTGITPVVENGMFNNPIIAIIALFVALALLRGDFWGGGNNGNFNQVTNDFLYTNLSSKVDQGFGQLANQGFQIDKDILQGQNMTQMALCQGFNGVNANITQASYNAQNCCCETNRNIDSLRYEAAQNTCAVTTNATANTQRILDKLCQMESAAKDETIYSLRTTLQTAQNAIDNANQTNVLINTLRPVPIPAYPVTSPYQAYYPYTSCAYSG